MLTRPRRSALYVPADRPSALAKAPSLAADVFILDLEDAISEAARAGAVARLGHVLKEDFQGRERVVRLSGTSAAALPELHEAVAGGADALLLPKVESVEQIEFIARKLPRPGPGLWIMVETPGGVLEAPRLACAAPGLLQVMVMGTADLGAALRLPAESGGEALLPALGQCLLAARAAGIDILDGVYPQPRDQPGLERDCRCGKQLGFDGKTLIHPAQIEVANRHFRPSPEELAQDRQILEDWQRLQEQGKAVGLSGGRLVEALHAREAGRRLALEEAIRQRERSLGSAASGSSFTGS